MKMEFRKKLENLLSKNSNDPLASYILECLATHDRCHIKQENPFGVELNKMPEPSGPIPANVGNKTTTGWSNPFGGTSWGV